MSVTEEVDGEEGEVEEDFDMSTTLEDGLKSLHECNWKREGREEFSLSVCCHFRAAEFKSQEAT